MLELCLILSITFYSQNYAGIISGSLPEGSKKEVKSDQKHPRCKKEQPKTKTGLAEKDVKSNGWPMPPGFDRFESFSHDDLTAKCYYYKCSRPADVYGIKIFDKDDQAATRCSFILMICCMVIFIKNFDPINIRRP